MPVARRQLAASIRAAAHIVDREAIASFIADEATEVGLNPFPHTTAGAQGHIWAGHSFDFRASQVEALGLACLLKALDSLAGDEPLTQEIFRSGPYRAYVYHPGDGCQIVGAVVYGRAGMALPALKAMPRRRTLRRAHRAHPQQLDLFAHRQHA
ncbi:hypothetical protein [Methylobacterium adhaesivum]|uniref:Uncharacterized protein n=1 Tax=Methylobacterium adhaesivum TaxID=333297 RepID=A0ABT8BK08_9HYPH|nr:hypothetical protein [Methylobacterium adhaesivum]MDN3591548.1 hypothetical protein [Methylobacterium adhaesivum]